MMPPMEKPHLTKEEVTRLLALSRIEMSAKEQEKLSGDAQAILGYISELAGAPMADLEKSIPSLKNVMREDGEAYPAGTFREALLKEAPAREGDYIKVKKIL